MAYASITQSQAAIAAQQLSYWKVTSSQQRGLQVGVFCIAWTLAIVGINLLRVKASFSTKHRKVQADRP